LFAGFGVTRFLAFETGYTDFGSPSESFGNVTYDLDLKVGALWAIGILPATERLSLYGRLGYSAWDAETTVNVPGEDPETSKNDGNDLAYGFGIAYNITPRLGLQLEWENYELDRADEVTFASLGVRWTF
jgi:OOP family OmpA-OmpF porin